MFNELHIRRTNVPICVCVWCIQLQPQLEYVKITDLVFQKNSVESSWGFTNRKSDEANGLIYVIVGCEHNKSLKWNNENVQRCPVCLAYYAKYEHMY